MDRQTTHDGVLNYTSEFNPSVVPFKRRAVFDAVGPRYMLHVRDSSLREVRVTNTSTPPDRTAFWGSVVLQVSGQRPVPIPSVAPEARIISYTATPATKITFFKDSADNFWVRARRKGRLRLVFLSDAPRRYFSPRVPPSVTVAQIPPARRPVLSAEVKRAAARVLARLKLSPGQTLEAQMMKLTAYFRGFNAGPMPRITADTYLDISLSKRGVCRHRSFAFVITAQALGIPARYVQNEAHAFTEVFIPRLGWARVDLGGASSELRVHNARDRVIHDPGPDPFPRPSRYATSYSQLGRGSRITGLRPGQRRPGRGRSRLVHLSPGERSPDKASSKRPATTSTMTFTEGEALAPPPPPPRLPVRLMLQSPTHTVFRGQRITVRGRALHRQAGVVGLLVNIVLSKDGRVGQRIGNLLTRQDGQFSGELAVPRDVEVGQYKVYATTPGNKRYKPSISR